MAWHPARARVGFAPLLHPTLPIEAVMAKKNIVLIRLVSSADTGYYYVAKQNPKNHTEKLSFRKYDPVVRKHVVFNEAKIK